MEGLKKIGRAYNKFEEVSLAAMLGLSVVLIFIQVIARKVFNNSISWSEEVTRYLFIWMIWLGTSLAQSSNSHIYVELICNRVKGQARFVLDIIVKLIWLLGCIFFAVNGMELLIAMQQRGKMATAVTWLPLWIVYLALPFSQAILGIRIIIGIVEDVVRMRRGESFFPDAEQTVQW